MKPVTSQEEAFTILRSAFPNENVGKWTIELRDGKIFYCDGTDHSKGEDCVFEEFHGHDEPISDQPVKEEYSGQDTGILLVPTQIMKSIIAEANAIDPTAFNSHGDYLNAVIGMTLGVYTRATKPVVVEKKPNGREVIQRLEAFLKEFSIPEERGLAVLGMIPWVFDYDIKIELTDRETPTE